MKKTSSSKSTNVKVLGWAVYFLLFTSFLFLLLSTLSASVIPSIYILKVSRSLKIPIHSIAKFGLWGFCFDHIEIDSV